VKLHASWHNRPIDGPEFAPIFELCEELALPVLIHSYVVDDFGDQNSCPERIANVAKRHKNPLIAAHMGGNARRCFKALRGLDHVYVDISSGRERASQLYVWRYGRVDEAVAELGAERVLFGSDFPLLDVSICMGMMADAHLDDNTRDLIMSGNARRIFGL
jgi:predicted TIM-barrel fold metal-dependent hydrolase